MDDRRIRISPQQVYGRICAGAAPLVIEIRDAAAFATNPTLIVGAVRRIRQRPWSDGGRSCAPATITKC